MLGRNYRITVDPSRGSSSNILVLGFCFFCYILKFIRNFPEIPLGIHPGFLPKFIASYVLEFRESIVTTMGETFVQGFLHEFLLRSFQGFLKQFPWGFFFFARIPTRMLLENPLRTSQNFPLGCRFPQKYCFSVSPRIPPRIVPGSFRTSLFFYCRCLQSDRSNQT